jgi:hypothetical protein
MDGAFVHFINRDAAERYVVLIRSGALKVYRLSDGSEVPVSFPHGTTYLTTDFPVNAFRAVSVVDYTFILNRERFTGRDTATVPARPFEALIWVKQGAYASKYKITVDGLSSEYETLNAAQPSNAAFLQTELIAANLRAPTQDALAARGVYCQQYGSILHYVCDRDFSVTFSDSLGDAGIKLVKDAVQGFSDLPSRAVDGFTVRVKGSNEIAYDDYYVRYRATNGNPLGGVWEECAKPSEPFRLDGTKMPHVLIRKEDGTFSFEKAPWIDRQAGSIDTIPFPTLVGARVQDIFFHRNRLGMLSGENLLLSRAGDFFNVFRTTAIQVLDTDPIDVAVATGGGSMDLQHAVAFNEGLTLFSEQAQFQFGKADLLTPKTASITLTTQFGCSQKAKPVGSGRNVYFCLTRGSYSAVREYYVDVDTRTNDAADITAHVPRYVPSDVTKLAAGPNEDILVALAPSTPNSLYVYRYYWQGTTKLQSSWSRWDFGPGDRVLTCEFIDSSLWLVIARDDGTFLEEVVIAPGMADFGQPFLFRLDRRVQPVMTHVEGDEPTTQFWVPYKLTTGGTYECVTLNPSGDGTKTGAIIPFQVIAEESERTLVSVSGTLLGAVFGRRYEMRYRFSTLFLREEAPGGGQQPVTEGRLQVRKMTLSHAETGYYRVEVTPRARSTYTYVFAGRTLGFDGNRLGLLSNETGNFGFSVASQNEGVTIDVVNDSFHASTFLSAAWEAFYTSRSRRV